MIEENFSSEGILTFNNTNNRIYTNDLDFLKLCLRKEKFLELTEKEVEKRLPFLRKKENWGEQEEKVYLLGRICGTTFDSLLTLVLEKLNDLPKDENKDQFVSQLKEIKKKVSLITKRDSLFSGDLGGRADIKTVQFIEQQFGAEKSYKVILTEILSYFKESLEYHLSKASNSYKIEDLLVHNNIYFQNERDIQAEAKKDYLKYWDKNPLDVCRVCHAFKQESCSATLFPKSDLGGGKDVFLTDQMTDSSGFGDKGGVCKWCKLWFLLLKNKTGNKMYKLCIVPHALFGRLNWDEIFESNQVIKINQTTENYIYPHVVLLGLSGERYSELLPQLIKNKTLTKIYESGLRSKVISTLIEPTSFLLDCGAIQLKSDEYLFFKLLLENVVPSKRGNTYALIIKSLKNNIYSWGYFIKTNKVKGDAKMIQELGEHTGLSFLKDIWVGGVGEDKVSNAEKIVRRMNETLRKLKDKEEKSIVIDAMISIGLKVAISTRATKEHPGIYGKDNNKGELEKKALVFLAEKLYEYKDNGTQRTELIRAMSCYLGYVPYTLKMEVPK